MKKQFFVPTGLALLLGSGVALAADTSHAQRATPAVSASQVIAATGTVKSVDAGAGKVIYLDPDIAAFAPLDPVVERLDGASIVLTPHQIAPDATAEAARESLQGGLTLAFRSVAHRHDPAAFVAHGSTGAQGTGSH